MNNLALDILTKKLKNATPDILERVSGYLDGILELSVTKYTLSNEQQKILDDMIHVDKSDYIDAEILYEDLKSRYDL